jgi:hypothetical protein
MNKATLDELERVILEAQIKTSDFDRECLLDDALDLIKNIRDAECDHIWGIKQISMNSPATFICTKCAYEP